MRFNIVCTLIELGGLVLVVIIGAAFLTDGGGDFGRNLEFTEGEAIPSLIVSGASLAFYALIGFEDTVNVAEETQEPQRTFPVALFGGLAIAGVVYLLVTLIASAVVPTDQLGGLLRAAARGRRARPAGRRDKVFSAIALFALVNGALINMVMASRLVYGMAAQGIVPRGLGRVHRGRRTPWVAIVFTTALAVLLISIGSLETLADTTVMLLLVVFTCVNVAVLALRGDRVGHEHFRAPSALPVIGALTCVALVIRTLVDEPADGRLRGRAAGRRGAAVGRRAPRDRPGARARPAAARGLSRPAAGRPRARLDRAERARIRS